MKNPAPVTDQLLMILATGLTFFFIARSLRSFPAKRRILLLSGLLAWLGLQALLGINGLVRNYPDLPPRILLFSVLPATLFVLLAIFHPKWKNARTTIDLESLYWLHSVRIVVEATLFLLFLHKAVAAVMTVEGGNFDIISGCSAPLIAWLAFRKKRIRRGVLIGWNLVCLALLIHVVLHALLSTPYPFQQFGFDQPTIAVFWFPFIWLPSFIVPAVLFSHLLSLRMLIQN
jgi:hypothetical protein